MAICGLTPSKASGRPRPGRLPATSLRGKRNRDGPRPHFDRIMRPNGALPKDSVGAVSDRDLALQHTRPICAAWPNRRRRRLPQVSSQAKPRTALAPCQIGGPSGPRPIMRAPTLMWRRTLVSYAFSSQNSSRRRRWHGRCVSRSAHRGPTAILGKRAVSDQLSALSQRRQSGAAIPLGSKR
jgi:hypothetical protein